MRLIQALEPLAADAAVGQGTAAGTIGAAFTIDAPDAGTALEEGRRLFDVALDQLGVSRGELVELHVAEAASPKRSPGQSMAPTSGPLSSRSSRLPAPMARPTPSERPPAKAVATTTTILGTNGDGGHEILPIGGHEISPRTVN